MLRPSSFRQVHAEDSRFVMNAPRSSRDDMGVVAIRRDWLELISQPGDELDQLALLEAGKRARAGTDVQVLQVDCGDAMLGLRLARAGSSVLAVDPVPSTGATLREAAQALGVDKRFRFQVWSTANCSDTTPLPGAPFDIVICPPSLSLLPYDTAHMLLRQLTLMTKTGGKLFISAYGIHSELSEGYAAEGQPIRQRFSLLAPEIANKYDLRQPVCLYSERDLFLLLFEAGLSVVRTFTTTHGNVKAIAVRV